MLLTPWPGKLAHEVGASIQAFLLEARPFLADEPCKVSKGRSSAMRVQTDLDSGSTDLIPSSSLQPRFDSSKLLCKYELGLLRKSTVYRAAFFSVMMSTPLIVTVFTLGI